MKNTIFILVFILTVLNIFPSGRRENMNATPNLPGDNAETINAGNQIEENKENIVKIVGRVEVYGHEPETFVGIIDVNDVQYAVFPPSMEEELSKLQGHLIEFTVVLLDEPQGFGSFFLRGGTVTPIKWELR